MFGLETILIAVAAVFAGIAAAFFKGKSSGKSQVRAEQAADRAKATSDARKVENEVAGQKPAANREELKRWS
ncbi:hypothetical protein [Aurantimonas sp. A3-2-R12]|uniref:hypothetical protein n=1 Tax=Aurantimonas sp. A3-2-R12 TaxID=3114362 RepID=UPI002E193F6F|nr:hypothetical protein [Aurantimonas sp. A3-2-R12]